MHNILDELLPRWRAGDSVAVSTVISVLDSAPLPTGSSQLVTSEGAVLGSVSGGCIEGAVYETGLEVLENALPVERIYTVSDDDAIGVGLTCGGTLRVFTEVIDQERLPWLAKLAERFESDKPSALATVVTSSPDGPMIGTKYFITPDAAHGSTGSADLDRQVTQAARRALEQGEPGILLEVGSQSKGAADTLATPLEATATLYIQTFIPKPRLIVFGAIDFASALAEAGQFAGYHVTVCDAREIFLTAQRFPHADELILEWPHEYLSQQLAAGRIDTRTALCVLTHDPKFDVPLLETALRIPQQCYIGAMGSRKTHRNRWQRLLDQGLSSTELARMHSPIGLDLGGSTPQHAAISIMGEIIAFMNGRSGESLSQTSGTIHPNSSTPVVRVSDQDNPPADQTQCRIVPFTTGIRI